VKIGITGGAGFIGSWVAQRAVQMGHEPVILDRTGNLAGTVGQIIEDKTGSLFLGDVRDSTAMAELAAHVDGIIHLAACLGTQETIRNPFPAAETNIVGGLNFLEACAQYNIPGVYIGVGNHWMENSYSITKTTVERFVRMYNTERGTRVNIVRAMNAYGPGQSVAPPYGPAKVRKITPAFVCRALTGAPIEVYGDGNQVSDMVHVADVATVLLKALESAADGIVFGKPVEVGPRDSLTVNEVAEIVRQAAATWRVGQFLDYGSEPVDLVHLPMRPGEIPGDRVSADHTTLSYVGMSYRDLIGTEEGLEATVKWYAENWLPDYLAVTEKLEAPAQRAIDPYAQAASGLDEAPLHHTDPDCAGRNCGQDGCNGTAPDFAAAQAHGQDH
jgi:UDP-glucose 4-epimerase